MIQLTKTEKMLIDLMARGKSVSPKGSRQWSAFGKITDGLHSTGHFGPLVGFVVPIALEHYRFIPLSHARELYTEHYSGKPGSRQITDRPL